MTTIVYKVVSRSPVGLRSIYALGEYTTVYTPGEKVSRPNLFVFLTQEDAQEARTEAEEEVWICETESTPRKCPERIPDYEHTGTYTYWNIPPKEAGRLIREFWEHPYYACGGPLRVLAATYGAHLVDDVTLIREVEI